MLGGDTRNSLTRKCSYGSVTGRRNFNHLSRCSDDPVTGYLTPDQAEILIRLAVRYRLSLCGAAGWGISINQVGQDLDTSTSAARLEN